MNAPHRLADDEARRTAIAVHDRSFLVEAGAGSGKTAVMAGRIALMLAAGIPSRTIAAVTFTELAASELLTRVRAFVDELADGGIPDELRVALPDGLSADHRSHLTEAGASIDELTCSTIHGFCQRLIRPYPAEADIDPGATLMDPGRVDFVFREVTDTWLRERLDEDTGGLLNEMILHDPKETVGLVRRILAHLRDRPSVTADPPGDVAALAEAFCSAAGGFAAFVQTAGVSEADTDAMAQWFSGMAKEVAAALPAGTPAGLIRLVLVRPEAGLCKADGTFRLYREKTRWLEAAKRARLSKAEGERLNAVAGRHYDACCEAWEALSQTVAAHVLAGLVGFARPAMDRFRDYKRSTALLDFDDLIFAARDLLRVEPVRRALSERFAHVLVDEFQDTDPLQTEIFWRLCGDPPAQGGPPGNKGGSDWTAFRIRLGALFLVGDPKQAIYRFRGADVAAYVRARDAFLAQDTGSVLGISTNFRSRAPILRYVNARFEAPLSRKNGQPGFTTLAPFRPAHGDGPGVAALNVAVADAEGKASAERQRDGEAAAVAGLCARLVGSRPVVDRRTGLRRLCRPGDIALLAPTGNDLWRYEEALEARGIPVATQAGKGLFRRQEIQDLIALTRVLADQRDTLALGALLRGPLVGVTEEQLLDIVWALPRPEDAPEKLPRLDLGVPPEAIACPYARDILEKLQALRLKVNTTTPHDLLSQAIDALRVRPILLQRHGGQAERVLANVDLYLTLSRAYAVRGVRAFAEAMTAAWTDESRAVEGRPDAQEDAVALYTMHAAKGLEWPVVIPVNAMTRVQPADSAVTDRLTGRFHCRVFDVKPAGYDAARAAERAELDRERVRLWYVAATRARDLLILPRLDVAPKPSAWMSLVDLSLDGLPALDLDMFGLGALPAATGRGAARVDNAQTREVFAAEAAAIAARETRIVWLTPSRDEDAAGPALQVEEAAIRMTDAGGGDQVGGVLGGIPGGDVQVGEDASPAIQVGAGAPAAVQGGGVPLPIQGGRDRGDILHKLIEEVLTSETAETLPALTARAASLIRAIGRAVAADPERGLVPAEIAGCAARALSLPEIASLRPRLMPEFPVYSSAWTEGQEVVTAGIADAIALGADGAPVAVVDWKSDVAPAPRVIEHYRGQVRAYLEMTGVERGLIVFATTGVVVPVTRRGAVEAATAA
jgi:ATP-dependent helicase/nuclease subunit A